MRQWLNIIAFAALGAGILWSCDSDQPGTATEKLNSEARQSGQAVRDATPTDREEFKRRAAERLRLAEQRLDEVTSRSARLGRDTKLMLADEIRDARANAARAREELKQIDSAGDELWSNFKQTLGQALDDLDAGTSRAAERLER